MGYPRHHELAFTGPATFFKAPYRPLAAPTANAPGSSPPPACDVGLLGIPYDFAVGYRPGARFAPAALREASGRYALPPEGFFDPFAGRQRLAGIELLDVGDVDPAQLEYRESFARITAAATLLRAAAGLPIFVGGDHSVSYPLLRAYADMPELHVVQLDAHLDFSSARNATRYANSSPFRRAAEELPNLRHITVVGLRGLRTSEEAWRAALERGHTLVGRRQLRDDLAAVLEQLPRNQRVYLSIDVDVFDPALLPGTSSPEVDGLDYREVQAIIAATIARNDLVGVDLTELAPNLDASGRSSLISARLLADVMALWWDARAKQQP